MLKSAGREALNSQNRIYPHCLKKRGFDPESSQNQKKKKMSNEQ
jgi:hypothetical protein